MKQEKKRLQAVYPWLIVLSCFCLQGGVLGIIHCCRGMFFDSLARELEVSLSALTGYVTIYGITSALGMPLATWMVDRWKAQYVLGTAAAIMACSQFVQAYFGRLWQWYAAAAVQGLCYTVLIPTVPLLLQNWFQEKQGMVLGIAGASSGIVGAVMNAVGNRIISTWGWRVCYKMLGTVLLVMMVPLSFLVVRKTPEELGLKPYGEKLQKEEEATTGISLKQAAGTVRFWLLLTATAIVCYLTCFNQLLKDFGMSREYLVPVAESLTIMAMVGNIAIKLVIGRMNDRLGMYRAFCFGLLLIGAGFAFLLFGRTPLAGFVGAFIMGGPMSLSVILLPIWTMRLFGKKYYFHIFSVVSMVVNFFAAFGYLLFTGVHDLAGGYDAALVFGLASVLTACGVLLYVRALEKRKLQF